MTELPEGVLEENMVLSNRDKSRHSDGRGLDSKTVQTEQFHDHAGNRRNFDAQQTDGEAGNSSGKAAPMSNLSGEDSSSPLGPKRNADPISAAPGAPALGPRRE
jgi:hypothetical protein